jgi:transglutaminase-like putative cysteine protease
MQKYLSVTDFFDFEDNDIKTFSDRLITPGMNDQQKAVALYYGVRDGLAYNPYTFSPAKGDFKASHCVGQSQSYCVPKAVLLVALARLNGIPARLGLADVKNHLSSPALLKWLHTDEFVMHGYAEMYLNGNWVKATPAFDDALCKKMGVKPLEFDGKTDSVFHEFNGEGEKAMEYLRDHGQFDDVPYELIVKTVAAAYPHLVDKYFKLSDHSLEKDLG